MMAQRIPLGVSILNSLRRKAQTYRETAFRTADN
jgi:hypothetical protein